MSEHKIEIVVSDDPDAFNRLIESLATFCQALTEAAETLHDGLDILEAEIENAGAEPVGVDADELRKWAGSDPEQAESERLSAPLLALGEAAIRVANRRIVARLRTFVRDYAEGDEEQALLDGLDILAELVEVGKVEYDESE